MRHVLLIIISTEFITHISAASYWQASNDVLAWNWRMAGGVYNDSIFLIGGSNDKRSVKQYQWTTQTFLTEPNTLDTDIYGYGQFWSQYQHIVYMIIPQGDLIGTYNMQTNAFISNFAQIPTNVEKHGCLASEGGTLYVVGGYNSVLGSLNRVQIFSTSTSQWTTNAPVMKQARGMLSCIATNNYLWAFGGETAGFYHITNERIRITDIMQNSWNYVAQFSLGIAVMRCISWDDIIYIIGGWTSKDYQDTVYKMDAITGEIISIDHLPYYVSGTYTSFESTPVIANGVLYVFGGFDDNGFGIENWLYLNLPTSDPTSSPTMVPTNIPTRDPTQSPTTFPTVPPSMSPTRDPSTFPTETPTLHPSKAPTLMPTSFPTCNPTTNPSYRDTTTVSTKVEYRSNPTEPQREESGDPEPEVDIILILLLILIGSLCTCIVIVLLLYLRRVQSDLKRAQTETQMVVIVSDTNTLGTERKNNIMEAVHGKAYEMNVVQHNEPESESEGCVHADIARKEGQKHRGTETSENTGTAAITAGSETNHVTNQPQIANDEFVVE